jgi:autotransporter-associated beta strand protein
VVVANVISGSGSLAQNGTGILTLTGDNDYHGSTSVGVGTLLVNGAHTGGGLYTVAGNPIIHGTLGGVGTINAMINVTSWGMVAPGQSIGTLTVQGNVMMRGTFQVELSGAGAGSCDLLDLTDMFDIAAGTLDFDALVEPDDRVYVFAKYGSLNGSEFLEVLDLPEGYKVDYAYMGHQIALVQIPEPASASLLLLGAGAWLVRWRRRLK